ncbi:MAG: RagB/SusD family nutrient uptake outer membrane protein [Bacteroidales bacterium]|nr:RagB/SusD family nutrient uptake outer membrane protein [Bacteroidales bacterium]
MKNTIKIVFIAGLLLILASCKKDFLEISDPNNPTAETYYTSVSNAQLAVNGVYGEFHDESLFFGEIFYILGYSTGEAEYIHPESRYTDFNNYNYGPTNSLITEYYKGWYRIVGRANATLDGISKMLESGTYTADEVTLLNQMKGQCYFLRGLAYSYLVRSFGEKMPSNPAYTENTPGVIISDSVVQSKDQMYKDRSSCGEVYKYIVKDFQLAESLLPASWPDAELGKATKGSAQAFLGETYVYLQDWPNAKTALDKVIANGQYKLMTDFGQNFDYEHINNAESLFEVGFNNWTIGYVGTYTYRLLALQSWGTTKIRTSTIDKFSSSVIINTQTLADGLASKATVFGSLYKSYVDTLYKVSVPLKGNSYASKEAYLAFIRPLTKIPFYKADGVTLENGVRQFVNAISPKDPRLKTTVYTPKIDTLEVFNPTSGTWSKKLYDYSNYGWKKNIPAKMEVEQATAAGLGNNGHMSMNFRIMRLDDVYLYYAEVMHNLGNDAQAKEYMNKVLRRANGKPINTPSTIDVNPTDVMAELKNQTYLELCLEGKVWFHYRRWNLGVSEWGSLGYKENKNECLPIPQGEFDSNPGITKQNIGY